MAGKTERAINTELAELIQIMGLEPDKQAMMMVDVETNNPSAMKGTVPLRVFDLGYGFVNPFSGDIGPVSGAIIYESILNPDVINQIVEWDKIRHASVSSYYGFFKLLQDEDWWNKDFDEEQIKSEMRTRFRTTAIDKLSTLRKLTDKHSHSYSVWDGPRAHWKNAAKMKSQRYNDLANAANTAETIQGWLAMGNKLEAVIESNSLTGGSTYESIVKSIYSEIYREQYESVKWEDYRIDQGIFKMIESKAGVKFKDNIQMWAPTIQRFQDELDKKAESGKLLAITAYNLSHERNAIRTMCRDFNTPKQAEILDNDAYRSICMQNMMGLLSKKEVQTIVNGLHTFDGDFFVEGLKESLNSAGKLNTKTFSLFYETIFNIDKYKQSHTGPKDVLDQSDALVEAFAQYVVPFLERK